MLKTFSHLDKNITFKAIKPGLIPTGVEIGPNRPGKISFQDGSYSNSTCLRCKPAPCMLYQEHEVTSNSLKDFPADRNANVCPSDAISRIDNETPVVSQNRCILCGICASRCPTSAISMNPYAVINEQDSEQFPETYSIDLHKNSIDLIQSAPRSGYFLLESENIIDEIRKKLDFCNTNIGDKFPNHLARNLLIAVGVGAAMRRKGDSSVRMDLVLGPPSVVYGCAEAEFGDIAILDAPRDLMDDIAVSVSRYGKNKISLIPLVITDVLPNRRSEYWRIISDIKKVLDISIGTVTVLALYLFIWNRKKINSLDKNIFYVDIETKSYRVSVLEKIVNRELKINFAPRPMIDVAK